VSDFNSLTFYCVGNTRLTSNLYYVIFYLFQVMKYGAPDHRRIIIEFLVGNVFTLSYHICFFKRTGQGLERVSFASLHGDFLSASYLAD
jgi:hypothetical protein